MNILEKAQLHAPTLRIDTYNTLTLVIGAGFYLQPLHYRPCKKPTRLAPHLPIPYACVPDSGMFNQTSLISQGIPRIYRLLRYNGMNWRSLSK